MSESSEYEFGTFDITAEVLTRIKNYDRARVRELFDCAKQKFIKAESDRKIRQSCQFLLRWEITDYPEWNVRWKTAIRCRKPSKVLPYDESAELCEEHYNIADDFFDPIKQEVESLIRIREGKYADAATVLLTYRIPELSNMLVPFFIFDIIGDEQLDITEMYLCDEVIKEYPEFEIHSEHKGEMVIPSVTVRGILPDNHVIDGMPIPLSRYQQYLLDENLISKDDLIWIQEAALRAKKYFSDVLIEKVLSSIQLMCHVSVFCALDRPLSVAQRTELLQCVETKNHFDWRLYKGAKAFNCDFSRLPQYQRDLLPIWKDAKFQAIKDQKNPIRAKRWRESLKGAYDIELPDDLIEWLNISTEHRHEYLLSRTDLKYLKRRLKEGLVLSKPSEIALEHAARLCGTLPYKFAISSLWQIRRSPPEIEDI